jgi:GNAT superfamily N-acetyltransferase
MTEFSIELVRPEDRPWLEPMTFPAYCHLLDLARTSRHPEQGDPHEVDPLGLVVRSGERIVGLILAELPVEPSRPAQVLSLLIDADFRRQGLGSRLLAALEAEVARRRGGRLGAVYSAGGAESVGLERIFEKNGWSEPRPRTLSVRFGREAGLGAAAFAPERMRRQGRDLEIFPWSSLDPDERQALIRSHEEKPWVTPALEAWRFDRLAPDPTSVGARYQGQVVGWVINHRVHRTVRFTCSFMRKDLSRLGKIVPLYRAAIARVPDDCDCSFVTPYSHPEMIGFIERWIAPIASSVRQTRSRYKDLEGGSSP